MVDAREQLPPHGKRILSEIDRHQEQIRKLEAKRAFLKEENAEYYKQRCEALRCFKKSKDGYETKTILDGAYALWLGVSLAFAGITFEHLSFWIILIPTIVLASISKATFKAVGHKKEGEFCVTTFIKQWAYTLWLSGSLCYSGVPATSVMYWVVIAPTVLLSYLASSLRKH